MEIPKFIIDCSQLTLKQILFIYEIPIFFVCTNRVGEYFLVYCSDIDELEYSIVPATSDVLLKMLDNKIAMYQIFESSAKKWRVKITDLNMPEVAHFVKCFEDDDLPKKDAMYGSLDDCVKPFFEELKKEKLQRGFVKSFKSSCLESEMAKQPVAIIVIGADISKWKRTNHKVCKYTIDRRFDYIMEDAYA